MKPNMGDRIRMVGVMRDPHPRPVGVEGTVNWLGQWTDELTRQIGVKWDDGSPLILLGDDPFIIVPKEES